MTSFKTPNGTWVTLDRGFVATPFKVKLFVDTYEAFKALVATCEALGIPHDRIRSPGDEGDGGWIYIPNGSHLKFLIFIGGFVQIHEYISDENKSTVAEFYGL